VLRIAGAQAVAEFTGAAQMTAFAAGVIEGTLIVSTLPKVPSPLRCVEYRGTTSPQLN
jgi:hypothetical protein